MDTFGQKESVICTFGRFLTLFGRSETEMQVLSAQMGKSVGVQVYLEDLSLLRLHILGVGEFESTHL